MHSLRQFVLGVGALLALGAVAAPKEEVVEIHEHRKVGFMLPAGFALERTANPNGVVAVKVSSPKGALDLQILFLPDPSRGELLSSARARKEFMVREFQDYVASSTEQAMQFEELEPRVGAGTYCAFTDTALVGKQQLPPNEFIHVTAGLKVWPGSCAVFRLFSNDTISAEYRALLAMLRDSVQEKPVSPLR